MAVNQVYDGTGTVVAVFDSGVNHSSLNDKIIKHAICDPMCREMSPGPPPVNASHATKVAQIIASTGLPMHNGIAPGVGLLDIRYGQTNSLTLAHGLDFALRNGADIVNMSFFIDGLHQDQCDNFLAQTNTYNLIVNEAVDKGMFAVKSAGNQGRPYTSITNPGCAHNIITVGGIDDRRFSTIKVDASSSRGPTNDGRLKPEIVAPSVNINVLNSSGTTTTMKTGTSAAAPQVSAAAAILLEAHPDLTPVELKAALLLGATWQGPIPCTSSQYEDNDSADPCSFAMQPNNHNAVSIEVLNNVGFGILNVAQSLDYTSEIIAPNHILGDYVDSQAASKQYRFHVTNTADPVKVILTWMVHPHGSIIEQTDFLHASPNIANLDFVITAPDRSVISAESERQTNEFAVFTPTQTGTYTITVTGSGLDAIGKPVQNYALASTHSLTYLPLPYHDTPPIAEARTIIVNPESEGPVIVRLHASDQEGDPVSFSISDDPDHGTVSTDEFITNTMSRVFYTPEWESGTITSDTFTVTPHDGVLSGISAVITLTEESLPAGSSDGIITSDNIRNWDTLEITSGFAQMDYSETFSGPSYPVSAIYVGSVNMEGVDLEIITTGGTSYTVAVPPSDKRLIEFSAPLTIRSATLSADGIDEETTYKNARPLFGFLYEDVRMFVGYVPQSCAESSNTRASCPAQPTYRATSVPGLAIPDYPQPQNTSDTIRIQSDGTVSDISVSIDIKHTYIGDLKVIITSPDGTQAVLHDRAGDGTNNIIDTFDSSSNEQLMSMVGTDIDGDWVLSIGDYESGDVGTLDEWSLTITYYPSSVLPPILPPTQTVFFSDDFESGTLNGNWIETGDKEWRMSTSQSHGVPILPGLTASNMVAHSEDCDNPCVLTLKNTVNLSDHASAGLSFWRFVDSGLDNDEYLKVEIYDGTVWNTIYHWSHNLGGDDDMWHQEFYDLAPYLGVSDFKIRFSSQQSSLFEDVQIDNVMIGPDVILPTSTVTSFTDDFHGTLSSWTLSGTGNWMTAAPHINMTNPQSGNKVLTSNNCDSQCIISLNSKLDTSSSLTIEFDRFVDEQIDRGEGLYIQYSTDDANWTTLASYTESNNQNTDEWEETSLTLEIQESSASLRFWAGSTRSFEVVEIDNLSISPTSAVDTTSPTFTHVPPSKTFEATGVQTLLTADDIGTATAEDAVDPNPTVRSNAPASFDVGTTIITWTATDSSDNSSTRTQRITVQDTTSPTINVPADVSFTTTDTFIVLTSANYSTATATDLVDPAPTITSNAPSSFDADATTIITWTATDKYFNSANDTQRITVVHSSLRIFVPIDITVEADHVNNAINIGNAYATHDTDTNITINNNAPPSFRAGTTTVVTWTATDSTGVTITAIQIITVQDTTDPIFDPVQNLDFVFDPDVPLVIYYDYPVATDLDNLAVDVTCTPASGTIFDEGSNTVTCTATDDAGNTADITFSIDVLVYDTTIFFDGFDGYINDNWASNSLDSFWITSQNTPVIVPGHDSSNYIAQAQACNFVGGCVMELTDGLDMSNHTDPEFLQFYRYLDTDLEGGDYLTLEAYDGSSWAELDRWNPENSDNDGAWHLEEYDLAAYSAATDFKVRFTAVAGTGADEFGIDDVRVFKVPSQTATDPVFGSAPDLDYVFAPRSSLAVDYDYPVATDSDGLHLVVTCTPVSGSIFAVGTTTVTCTATDDSGSSANVSFDVRVSIATPVGNSVLFFDDFEDGNLDGWIVPVQYAIWEAKPLDENVYPPDHADTNKVAQAAFCDIECTMTSIDIDLTGHDNATLQFYRYVDDSLDNTEYLKVEVYNGVAWVQLDIWTPENADDDDTWYLEDYSLSEYAGITDFKVRFGAFMSSFIEVAGIDDVKVFTVPGQISNVTALTITAPIDITVEAEGILTVVDIGTVLPPGGNVTITNNAPEAFNLGHTTVTWTAAGNGTSATDTQIITVQDTTPPEFGAVQNVRVATASQGFNATFAAPVAIDLVDGTVNVSCTPESGTRFGIGNTTVTCTAVDDSENQITTSFTVSVERNQNAIETYDVLFYDNFEIDGFSKWNATGMWHVGSYDRTFFPPPQAHNDANLIAGIDSCTSGCVLTMLDPVDLTGGSTKSLSFYAAVDSEPNNDIIVELYNGTGWGEIDRIGNSVYGSEVFRWNFYKYSLDSYSHVDDFKVRFTATSTHELTYNGVDDVRITEDRASVIPTTDSFETLGAWWQDLRIRNTGTYSNLTASINGTYGNPQPSLSLGGHSDGARIWMERSIDMRGLNGGYPLLMMDRINSSNETGLTYPNTLFLGVLIRDTDSAIYTSTNRSPFPSDWVTITINTAVFERFTWDDYIKVGVGIDDNTRDPIHRSAYFDNLYVGSTPPLGNAGGASGSSGESSDVSLQDPVYLAMTGDGREETCRDMFGPGMEVLFVPQNVTVTCPLDLYE